MNKKHRSILSMSDDINIYYDVFICNLTALPLQLSI